VERSRLGSETAFIWNELVDSATNRLVSNYYNRHDANGNQTRMPWPGGGYATLWYDKLNRLAHVDSPDGDEYYEYAPGGDRIYRKQVSTETSEWYYFYGAYGRLLAVYEQNGTGAFGLRIRFRNLYFPGGRERPARLRRADGGSSGARLPAKGVRGRWTAVLEG